MSINFQNVYVDISIELEPFFKITKFVDRKTGKNILEGQPELIAVDRQNLTNGEFLGQTGSGNSYEVKWRFNHIIKTRHLFFYDSAPAIRWYDVYEAEEDCSGMYYSSLAKFKLLSNAENTKVVNWFSASDHSNHRELESVTRSGKNVGAYFITEELFLYKEGPMPDCQPIKGEYDFVYDSKSQTIEMLGLGFENLRPGEIRRTNGTVIGLTRDFGMQRYNLERYADYPAEREATTVTSNSWPDLEMGISEEAIEKELHSAVDAGINVVFIDDGWFEPYMGPIDEKKFPNKFNRLAEIAKGYGIEIGLWCNPLCLDLRNPNMKLWCGFDNKDLMKEEGNFNWLARTSDYVFTFLSIPDNSQPMYTMGDLMVDDFYNYMKDYVAGMYKDYGIRHFKFDCYQLSKQDTRLGDANLHYEKYRELCADIQREIPDMVISFDVTRGNRPNFNFALDYGRLFLENRGRHIPDHRYYHPYMALGNTWYTMKYVQPRQLETEMMPQAMDYDLEYILGTTIFSTPLYWGCITSTPEDRRCAMKEFYSKMAPLRKKFAEYICFPMGDMPLKGSWSAVVALEPDYKEGFVAVYRNGAESQDYTLEFPYGDKLEKIFGEGDASVCDGTLKAVQTKDFSCSLYRFTPDSSIR